ncbi:hypothetical protein LP415_26335 [Polaromonas sp. P1(28)-8]|nr:hypothetical protein LP415_26335 [Polaromonas sp. P1(28)-8]
MPASIIDSRIFGDMFSDAKMRQVWSDENRTAKYLDIERARQGAGRTRPHPQGSGRRDRQELQYRPD